MANEVAEKPLQRFQVSLDSLLQKGIKALPNDVNSDRLKLNALMYISQNEKLKQIATTQPALIAQFVYNFIALGLDMLNGECYIIPYKGVPKVVRDYKGEEKLMKKYSVYPIKNIESRVVCENDKRWFDESGVFHHDYDPFMSDEKRGKKIGAYCRITYQNNGYDIEFVNLDEIKRVKEVSQTSTFQDSPWNKWEESMFRKTAIKKAKKHVPLDFGAYSEVLEKAYRETDTDVDFDRKNTDEVIAQDEPMEVIDVEVTEHGQL